MKPSDKPKKKIFKMLLPVRDFMRDQSGEIKQELNNIIWRLETEGMLEMPYGEKSAETIYSLSASFRRAISAFFMCTGQGI